MVANENGMHRTERDTLDTIRLATRTFCSFAGPAGVCVARDPAGATRARSN